MTKHRHRLALLVAVVGLWLTAAPAAAHDQLASSSPSDQQKLERMPASVVLTFDEPALAMGSKVVVTGPGGEVQQGPPVLVDDTVTQALRGDAPAGDYTVSWRVTSGDGHPVSGSFTFSARAAGTGTPPGASRTATPQSSPTGPSTGWLWLVLGVLAVGTTATLMRRRTRSRQGAEE